MLTTLTLGIGACSGRKGAAPAGEGQPVVMTSADSLRQRLTAVASQGKTIFGHHDDPVYGHSWKWEEDRSDVLETAGDYPGMMSWDLGRIESADSANLDGVPFDRMRAEVAAQDARGGINTYSWHLYAPITDNDSWNISDSTIVSRMVNDSTYNAAYRAQLRNVAAFFNSLTDAQGRKIGVIFRPWHEHSGGWFWWGAPFATPDEYKALWRIMREEMDAAGVDNVLYAYSPDRVGSMEQYMERYPGDDLVDILGIDIYHFGGESGTDTYREDAARGLAIVRQAAEEHGKIAAFSETGLESVVIPEWYTDVLLPLIKANPVSYVVVWRNAWDKPEHYYAPYPGHPAEASFRSFANDSTILFSKPLSKIK